MEYLYDDADTTMRMTAAGAPADDEDTAPERMVRGVLYAFAFSVPFWAAIVATVVSLGG